MASILEYLFYFLFFYFAITVFYLFSLSVAGRLFSRRLARATPAPGRPGQLRIAILVPAYKEDGIILSTATSHLQLDYPRELFDVYILADSFKEETLAALRETPVEVLVMSFEKSTKIKSLNSALSRIQKEYDIVVISDADNVLARDFLKKIEASFLGGERVVQGRRVAKNMDTSYAILDACSEGINNHIFRKGPNAWGVSAPLIGSGMAFDHSIIRGLLQGIDSVVEDKVLQLRIVEQGLFIRYREDALIFDEKVDSSHALQQQRRRWVSGQFVNLRESFFPAVGQLMKGKISYFNFGVMNNLVLPRAFLFVLLPALVVAGWFVSPGWGIASTTVLLAYLFSLAIAIPRVLLNRDLLTALLKLPKAIFVMAGALFKLKKSHKVFIHTVHTKTEISNSLFNKNGK
ncbi:MAG TPA: glycosyltransferase family 2 protein [Puia sp.]|jgi:cellulose synthase/poly-beta-1,6-N-acetylglucosamine synthase-like glycosyltransferase|nr:glycosyltransferase family 2 protein [Puia sp.]